MCGIAGAIGAVDDELRRVVATMSGAQVHRGPDSSGEWSSPPTAAGLGGLGACFAFRRLAILDLTADGDQPMRDAATGNVIVFNGEIYNHAELRRELEDAGETLKSRSDTEVLLRAWGRFGEACLGRLRGMFAFAIYDARRRAVVLARDRLGIKPLYYATVFTQEGHALLFASEVRALLASGRVSNRIDRGALSTCLWNGFVLGSQSIVEGVRELQPGCYAIVDTASAEVKPKRYWRLPAARTDGSREELRATLLETVRQHLVSDVPVGVFLSGGIDSSAIASLAVRSGARDVRTFNVGFAEARFDESVHARAVAQALGTRHEEIRLDERAFAEGLDDALGALDQPSFDALNTWFVSRAVRRAGVTVALAGTGGDELFGGYRSFRDLPRARRAQRLSSALPQSLVRRAARSLAHTGVRRGPRNADVPPQTRWGKLDDLLSTDGSWVELYQVSYALYTRAFLERIAPALGDLHVRYGIDPELRAQLEAWIADAPDLHAISTLELHSFLGQRLLRDTDAASMAVSLEVRVPLVDHRVVEAAAALDERARFEPLGTKRCLREIGLEGLDPALFDRPKSGFVLPIERWCRAHLSRRIAATFADRHACAAVGLESKALTQLFDAYLAGCPGLYWSRIWAPFALISWCQRHAVSL